MQRESDGAGAALPGWCALQSMHLWPSLFGPFGLILIVVCSPLTHVLSQMVMDLRSRRCRARGFGVSANPQASVLRSGPGGDRLRVLMLAGELKRLARRCLFTQRAVAQYTGFVGDRLGKARKALLEEERCNANAPVTEVEAGDANRAAMKHRRYVAEQVIFCQLCVNVSELRLACVRLSVAGKYIYHAMHKLSQLRAIAAGAMPQVYLPAGGPESDRERIMKVRVCELPQSNTAATDESWRAAGGPEGLQGRRAGQLLRTELAAAEAELIRLERGPLPELGLPEEVDFSELGAWLESVRQRMCQKDFGGVEQGDEGAGLSRQPSIPSAAPPLLSRQLSSSSSVADAAVSDITDADPQVVDADDDNATRVAAAKLFGVPYDVASDDPALKKAYRKLAMQTHPDGQRPRDVMDAPPLTVHDEGAATFPELDAAYKLLSAPRAEVSDEVAEEEEASLQDVRAVSTQATRIRYL